MILSFEFTLQHYFRKRSEEINFLIRHKGNLILIPSNNENSSRDTSVFKGAIKSIVYTPQQNRRLIVQVIDTPFTNGGIILFFEIFGEIID